MDIDIKTDKKNEDSTTVHIRPICDCGYVFDNLQVVYMRESVGPREMGLLRGVSLIYPFCCPACKKRISSILAEGELFRQLVNETKKYDNDNVIELPCKEHFVYKHDDGHITENWRVFYRAEFALIGTAVFQTEPEADAFLEELKNKAKEKEDRELAELYDVTDTFNRLAGKKRAGGKLTDAEVDEMLASYNRMCEIEKKRGIRK